MKFQSSKDYSVSSNYVHIYKYLEGELNMKATSQEKTVLNVDEYIEMCLDFHGVTKINYLNRQTRLLIIERIGLLKPTD